MPRERRKIPWLEVRDATYYVYWYDETAKPKPRTKRLSLGTADSLEAQQRYANFLATGHARFGAQASLGVTVSFALDDYEREHVRPHVVDKRRAAYAVRHLKAWFKDTLLKDVDIPASRCYADARRMGIVGGGKNRKHGEGKDSTIRRELVVLQAAANHALRWKRITNAELPSIELPREGHREEIWLTPAELARAIGATSGRLKDFMMIAYYTAARRASIEKLTRFQVDLKNGRINLTSPNEDINQRRSVKRRPVVPIFPEIRSTIERLLNENSQSEWLFGDTKDVYAMFKAHMTKIGLEAKSRPHILRHSRATHLLQDGVPLYDVAKLLGDTVATVERVYSHHCPEFMAATIQRSGQ